jgi:flavin reductase (DIM6/NTAB) family NADH-FMN oxidoreductase RutF
VPSEPTADDFRQAAGRFASGITVVTTTLHGVDHAMTANSFTSVSLDPLLVLVCAERETRFHDAVLTTGQWAVSVLPAGARDAAVWFATKGRPLAGQMDRFATRRGPHTGAPVLVDALAVLECATVGSYDGGDHTIVVGRVVGTAVSDDPAGPLLYYSGGYDILA